LTLDEGTIGRIEILKHEGRADLEKLRVLPTYPIIAQPEIGVSGTSDDGFIFGEGPDPPHFRPLDMDEQVVILGLGSRVTPQVR
jgi:hypothetical protein